MLVDSHCHLDFPDFAGEIDAVVERALAAGIGRMVTISTRVRKFAQVLAVAEKFPEVFCSVGTHPHNAHEELDIDAKALMAMAKPQSRGDRRGRPRLSLRQLAARRAGARLSPTYCRGTRNRLAAGHSCARSRRRYGADFGGGIREGAFPAVLHCLPEAAIWRCKAMDLGLYFGSPAF